MIRCQAEVYLIFIYFINEWFGNAKAGKIATVRSLASTNHEIGPLLRGTQISGSVAPI
jgi:hypothetical protein